MKVCAALPQPSPTKSAMVSSLKTMPSAVVADCSALVVKARATSVCVTSMAQIRTTSWVLEGHAMRQTWPAITRSSLPRASC
jgi:hypothetical protein